MLIDYALLTGSSYLLYKAVNNIFKDSYEYTRKYREFYREMNKKMEREEER